MKKRILIGLVFWGVFSMSSLALADKKVIKLKDGGTIQGEILSEEGGQYKIKTESLGVIVVPAGNIATIEDGDSNKWDVIEKKIVESPENMQSIKALSTNQEVLDMLADQKLKDAVIRQDVDYLRNNEKFIRFMNNAAVKKIIENTTAPENKN